MSEKLDALVKKLKESGHHGFYNDEGPCGCSWNDMAPCGECPIEQGCVGGFIGPPNGDGFDLCDYMIYPTQEAAAKAAAQVTGFCPECERLAKENAALRAEIEQLRRALCASDHALSELCRWGSPKHGDCWCREHGIRTGHHSPGCRAARDAREANQELLASAALEGEQ